MMNYTKSLPISMSFLRTRVAHKLFHNLLSQGSIFTGKWIFNFTLAKMLPPAIFGVFTLIQALGNFSMNLFSFGAVGHLIHGISENKQTAYQQLIKSVKISFMIILTITAGWLVLYMLSYPIPHANFIWWSILIGSILSFNVQLFAFFKGLGDFQKEARAGLIFLAASSILVAGTWALGISENVHILCGIFAALQCIILLSGFFTFLVWKKENSSAVNHNSETSFMERIPFGLHEIQGAIYIHVILLILGFMVPEEQLALYRSVQLFITPVSLLPGVVSQVTLNKLSSQKKKPLAQIRTFRKFLKYISLSGLVFFFIYAIIGEEIISYVYNYRYDSDVIKYLITCFSAAFLLRFISSNYGVFITSAGHQKIRVLMTFLSIIVSIVLTYLLTKHMGVKGAALAGVASFGVITIGYAFYCEVILFKQLRKNASNNFRS